MIVVQMRSSTPFSSDMPPYAKYATEPASAVEEEFPLRRFNEHSAGGSLGCGKAPHQPSIVICMTQSFIQPHCLFNFRLTASPISERSRCGSASGRLRFLQCSDCNRTDGPRKLLQTTALRLLEESGFTYAPDARNPSDCLTPQGHFDLIASVYHDLHHSVAVGPDRRIPFRGDDVGGPDKLRHKGIGRGS